LAGLQQSKLDRTLLTSNCNYYFTDQAIADYRTSLEKLGAPPASNSKWN
jgi:D-alanyl-D-alanine carboxypeptidase